MSSLRFDLNLLLVFEAVLETKSTTRAAVHLGLTQSAVSNALNRLRTALGDPLFVKTAEGMMPTPRAIEISSPFKDSIERIRNTLAQQPEFDAQSSDRAFRLYMSDVGQMVLLPKVLHVLEEEAPGVSIETVQLAGLKEREAAMSSGEVDLAVGYFLDFRGPFHCQALFREEYVCMVREGHPLLHAELTLEGLATAAHAVYQPTGGGHSQQEEAIDAAFEAAGVQRKIRLRATHFLGFTRMISSTDMITTLPSRLALAASPALSVRTMRAPVRIPSFEITQFWHKRFHLDPGNKWLRRLFARTHASMGAANTLPAEIDISPEDAS